MTGLLALVAFVAAVNAPRARFALDQPARTERVIIAGTGAVAALAGVVLAAVIAEPLVDGFGVSVESARIGVGVVVSLAGARDLVVAMPSPEPALRGRGAALVPIAFPVLLNPALVFLAFAVSLDHEVAVATLLAMPALALLPLLAIAGMEDRARQRTLRGLARLVAGLLVIAGTAIAVEGVLDI